MIFLSALQIIVLNSQSNQPFSDYVEHDLPELIKEKPRHFSWEDHRMVVIGSYYEAPKTMKEYTKGLRKYDVSSRRPFFAAQKECRTIGSQLRSLGFEVAYWDRTWPRNNFLSFDNTIVYPMCSDENLTQGGLYVFGRDFVIVSDSLLRNYTKPGSEPRRITTTERTVRKFWEALGIEKVYFMPPSSKSPNTDWNGDWEDETLADIDYTVNSIPWKNIITVDEDHYQEQKDLFERIAKEERIELIRIPHFNISGSTVHGGEFREYYRDLYANSFLALAKMKRYGHKFHEDLDTYVIYNQATPVVDDVFFSSGRNIHALQTVIPVIANLSFNSTIHCVTNTLRDRAAYEAFVDRIKQEHEKRQMEIESRRN